MKLDFSKIEWTALPLADVKRVVKFPYPLMEIGTIHNHVMRKTLFTNKLEITIRISSAEKLATDIIDGITYNTPYPNVAVKIPGREHQYAVSAPRDAIYFSYAADLADSMAEANLFASPPVWTVKLTTGVKHMIHELIELMSHSREYGIADRMDLAAFRLYEELLFMRHDSQHQDEFIETKMQRIESYFHIHFNQEIDFDKLIRDNALSRRSFFRHWKKHSDLSPKLYLQELKLQEACRLISVTDKQINEIADLVNFRDFAYFCALFRKRYGLTPLQYRKQHADHQGI